MVDTRVIAAKRAHANYGHVNEVVGQSSVLNLRVVGRLVDLITKERGIGHEVLRAVNDDCQNLIIESAPFSAARSGPRGRARAGQSR
jgi:hypothetical protein